ncbi:MAG: ABC transporter ATP-binding protein [Lachnospiraceae bacterium]|nr:ABC transporter ATP-binding protein [Lachnospiraceae bacterium]
MIRKILAYVKEYKAASIATPCFMILEVIMEMIVPYLMATLVDDGINAEGGGNLGVILLVGGLMIVAALVGLFAGIMGGKYGAKAATGLAKNLRQGMFEKIQTFSFSNIDRFSTAGLVTRLTTDVTNVQNAYQMALRMCMRAPASLIIALVMSFIINPRIALIYLAAAVFLAIVLSILISRTTKVFSQAFPKYDELNASVQENVSGIRVVKAFVREDHEVKKFKKASAAIRKIFTKAEILISFNNPVMNITSYTCILLVSWVGANMIVNSGGTELTTGDLISLLSYCMSILFSLMMVSMVFVMLTMSFASIKRINEVLSEDPDITNPENPVKEIKDGSINFEGVAFKYDKQAEENILDSINVRINAGETIGIIGGTGSGKSTLVSLISRLYDTTDGHVLVGGKDVREYDIETLRDEVSVVLQKNVLFSGTIAENLAWGIRRSRPDRETLTDEQILEECRRACKLACIDDFIESLPEGYNTRIEQGGTNVSGGQKQRLCIARALIKKPKILVLDDSTSAVDTATDASIRDAFANEIPDTTKIIISQRILSVCNADRIIVMDDGRISGVGTHEELLRDNEIYKDIYESQTGADADFDERGSN